MHNIKNMLYLVVTDAKNMIMFKIKLRIRYVIK